MKGKTFLWGSLFFLYAGLIFSYSSLPGDTFPFLPYNLDKVLHFGEYFVFGLLTINFFEKALSFKRDRNFYIICFIVGTLYGLSDEVHQLFVPLRYCSLWDWFADSLGILTALLVKK